MRRLIALLAVAFLFTALPVKAAITIEQCNGGDMITIWSDDNYHGAYKVICYNINYPNLNNTPPATSANCYNGIIGWHTMNDCVSSVSASLNTYHVCLYQNTNYSGYEIEVFGWDNHMQDGYYFSTDYSQLNWDDKVSSIKWILPSGSC